MDLAAQQRELARRAVGLQSGEQSAAAMPLDQVESFARSLLRKRAGEVRKLLPRTADALGPEFEDQFARYAWGRPLPGARRYWLDAVGFARSLTKNASPYVADLALYEAAWIEMKLGRRALLRRFRHAVDDPDSAQAANIWMVWIRVPAQIAVWEWRCWPPSLIKR